MVLCRIHIWESEWWYSLWLNHILIKRLLALIVDLRVMNQNLKNITTLSTWSYNMPDVGKQTQPIHEMLCPKCNSNDTELRLPKDMSKKKSWIKCNTCKAFEVFP